MNRLNRMLLLLLLMATPLVCFGENSRIEKTKWWEEARFGMFIHWGVYSVFGNMYEGLDVNGNYVEYDGRGTGRPSEWLMNYVGIPRAIYREAAKEFDAKDYNPKEWVRVAKEAGMKYIVITSKHHEGFCLFETKYTDWNSIDASPAKRDLLKDLVTEAKIAGLKIGFYYSQNLDWMAVGSMGLIPELNYEEYPAEEVEKYVNNQVIPQIKELTENYDIDLFWFDYPSVNNSSPEISQRILNTLLSSPIGDKVIFNNRLINGFDGDFFTPETDTPNIPYNGYPDDRKWEACASLTVSWGYEYPPKSWNEYTQFKSGLYTISRVLELASKGGNFLLNVGPDKHGVIPEESVKTLKDAGEWMAIYGDAVYGTQKNSLVNPYEYGYVTEKIDLSGKVHWYLHTSSAYWDEGFVIVDGIKDSPRRCTIFNSDQPLQYILEQERLYIYLPKECPNKYYVPIDVEFDKEPEQVLKSALKDNCIRLTPFQGSAHLIKKDFVPYAFKFWYRKDAELKFEVYLDAGEYLLQGEYSSWNNPGELYIDINGDKYTANYKNTGSLEEYIFDDSMSESIVIPESKRYTIKMKRNAEIPNYTNWIYVREFRLKKVEDTGIVESGDLIYPNPIKNGYFICKSENKEGWRIYDSLGKLCKVTQILPGNIVDVRDLLPGIYVVKNIGFEQKIIISDK